MSQLAVCLVEFLAFLGVPYLKLLKAFISSCITQLRIAEGELVSQLAFTKAASTAIEEAIGIAQVIANDVENTIGGLPLGVFQDCQPVSQLVGTLRGSFDSVLGFYDESLNEANRIRAFTDLQSIATAQIDEQITYLENLNDQIDVIILNLLRQQAANL